MKSRNNSPKLSTILKKVLTCLVFLSLVIIVIYFQMSEEKRDHYPILKRVNNQNKSTNTLIQTEGCILFKTKTTPVKPKRIRVPNCSYEETLYTMNDERQILHISEKFLNVSCGLHTIWRDENNDNRYTVSNSTKIGDQVDVKDEEMFMTRCGHHLNFEANLKMTPNIQRKIQKWETTPPEEIPVSVLFFGIDSTSRSLAHRSLPKTIEFMEKMGFVDFKGYHSAGPGTVFNVMTFLAGLPATPKTGFSVCHQTRNTSFDNCPFIWRNYSERDYITMYIEDGRGTFNWGNQGGFQKRPTDFYIHSLFVALEEIRQRETYAVHKIDHNLSSLETYAFCPSRASSPEFMKKYTERFLKKFIHVPTFSFTWFANPFHNYKDKILPEYDEFFLDFFQFLNSTPRILEDTLIVFVSDHGDRYSPKGERFLELSLPFLFIRVPEKLQKKYPKDDLMQALLLNSERLTSPLDLHSTFLHILHLGKQDAHIQSNIFKPNLITRSSLLFPVNLNRTCADIPHVENCVCNILPHMEPVDDTRLLMELNTFAVEELNQFVQDSNYSDVCEEWTPTDQYSGNILRKTPNYMEITFQFVSSPSSSQFQVKIRNGKAGPLKLIGKISRTNEYGNQSWCVHSITHLDKEMKALCYCKSKASP